KAADRCRAHRDDRLVPARDGVRLRRGDDSDAGVDHLPDAEEGGTRSRLVGGDPLRRRHRGRDLPTRARTGGLPHGRDPQDQLPRRRDHGDDADDPLLPRHPADDRGRRAPDGHAADRARCARLLDPHRALLVPIHEPLRDHRVPRHRFHDDHRRLLVDRAGRPRLVREKGDRALAPQAGRGARVGHEAGARGRRDDGGRRHHRRDPAADRARPEGLEPHPAARARQPRAHARRLGGRALGPRPFAADHRDVPRRRPDGDPGAHAARRPAARGAHVRLLLRRPLGGVAARRALAVRRVGDHGRQPLSHDDAHLEVRAAVLPCPVHVHAARRPRHPLARRPPARRGRRVRLGLRRHRRDRRRRRRISLPPDERRRAPPARGLGPVAAGARKHAGHRRRGNLYGGGGVAALGAPVASLVHAGVRRTAALAACIFIAVLVSRAPFVARTLWAHDSVLYARALEQGFHVDDELRNQRPHPPGYILYVASAAAVRDGGLDSNAALVLVSALASALGAMGVFLLARRFVPDRFAIIAGAAYAADPLVWQYSEIAYPYAVLGLGSIAIAAAALRARGRGIGAAAAASVVFGLAGGFRQDLLLLFAPLWLWCVWPLGARRAALAGL